MKKLRLATLAVSALISGAGLLAPTSAQAATTYWTFENQRFNTCLTAGDSTSIYATVCHTNSTYQNWDWVGSGHGVYHQLKNQETGLCLMTDNKTNVNSVWQSDCSTGAAGQWWFYADDTWSIFNQLGGAGEEFLRTSDVKDAVYCTDLGQVTDAYYDWNGYHN
ncbi:RICIN domain-containing protein [Streptomyces adustus]|uniref:RICIN domain-containing protein n=1 Tax=Streptomyces adustus TaxID=1609272 RepID=UPI0013913AFD